VKDLVHRQDVKDTFRDLTKFSNEECARVIDAVPSMASEVEWQYYEGEGWRCFEEDGEDSVFWIKEQHISGGGTMWVLRAGEDVILGGSTDLDFVKEKVGAFHAILRNTAS
jgi:hypothetical protein